ncbi:MAG TPA: T9SS type A sorting domain-containing protein, partial [Bacteroidales bacterium]|nr:T9SS type A sorting domain-containing protein [Bacteroidales bacterium]
MAQTFPIPAESAEWNEDDVDLESYGPSRYGVRMQSLEDTIINKVTYNALYQTISTYFIQTGECEYNLSGPNKSMAYLGAIRTDENQVFFIPAEDSVSYIIYDFSLNQGDTINWSRPDIIENFVAAVTDTDSILIGGKYRKRISLDVYGTLPDQWIEGIGSINGLFSTFGYRSWEKIIHELMCYRDNDIIFNNFGCNACDIISSYNNIETKKYKIFPNPTHEEVTIEFPDNVYPIRINIYESTGKLVFQIKEIKSNPINLNLANLNKGIFFIEIINRDKS